MYDIIIIGMGISGITAGIYAKRSNKKVLIIDKGMPGGILNNIDKISNYPGLIDISGPDFAVNLLEQPKFLGLDNEQELLGHGLSTCAMCDGAFFKDKTIAVVGTGNSALQEALYLANIVDKIYLINRRDGFRGEEMLVENIKDNPKIEVIYNANIKELEEKNGRLSGILLDNNDTLDVSGLFIYIGYTPATEIVPNEILDEEGYVKVDEKFASSIKGVYAIGDCIKKDVYQLVTATSDGARVIYNMK